MAGVCEKDNPANARRHWITLDVPDWQQPRNDKEHQRNPEPPSLVCLESCECHSSMRADCNRNGLPPFATALWLGDILFDLLKYLASPLSTMVGCADE